MQEAIRDKIKNTLPEAEFDNLYAEHTLDANGEIINGYLRGGDPAVEAQRIENMKDLLGLVTLKEVRLEDLPAEAGVRLGLDAERAKAVALIMLQKIFFPIKDFFPGLEDAIWQLGGELPKTAPKPLDEQLKVREQEIETMQRQEELKEQERLADTIITAPIDKLMEQYPEVGQMTIGSQTAIAVKNMSVNMKPMIKYWIHDYKEKMGYYQHSNLERVQYVCHDTNTRSMNEEERRQLNLVLKSCDGEIELPLSTRTKKIDFSLVAED